MSEAIYLEFNSLIMANNVHDVKLFKQMFANLCQKETIVVKYVLF